LRRFEELSYWVREELPVKEAILDGEVMALDSEGRQNLHYAAFDALWIDGKDLRPLLLTRRKQLLSRLIPATTTVLSQVFSIEERCREPVCSGGAAGPGGDRGQAEGGCLSPRNGVVQDQESGVYTG
jgi:hypothetical protein